MYLDKLTNRIEFQTIDKLYYFVSRYDFKYLDIERIINEYEKLCFDDIEIQCSEIINVYINEFSYLSQNYIQVYQLKTKHYGYFYMDLAYE